MKKEKILALIFFLIIFLIISFIALVIFYNGPNLTFAPRVDYQTGNYPTGFMIDDLNSDGIPDLVTSNFKGTVSVLINHGNGTFTPYVDYPIGGNNPSLAIIGDLNGDGKKDLIVGYESYGSPYTASVFMNNGDGTFAPHENVKYQTKAIIGQYGSEYSYAIGELNKSGIDDLVMSDTQYNKISVFMNNGNGTFATNVDYPTGTSPIYAAVSDLNGDGRSDLVTNNLSGTFSVLINNGDGTFASHQDYPTGIYPMGFKIVDLNGDKKPDLVTFNSSLNEISILINKGNGTFDPPVTYGTGLLPTSFSIGDLNGDGKPDLVTANVIVDTGMNVSGTVSVLINKGNGTFSPHIDYPTGVRNIDPVVIGDLNGDGKPDLTTFDSFDSSSNKISILINKGDGTYNQPTIFKTGFEPNSLSISDLNGDGKPDLVTANATSTVSVLTNVTSSLNFLQLKILHLHQLLLHYLKNL
jgi:hypothetical protein